MHCCNHALIDPAYKGLEDAGVRDIDAGGVVDVDADDLEVVQGLDGSAEPTAPGEDVQDDALAGSTRSSPQTSE